jgi:hypothetical protein
MSGDHKPHFKRAALAPASEGPLGVEFDEDGARSPGSVTGHNPHALLALFGRDHDSQKQGGSLDAAVMSTRCVVNTSAAIFRAHHPNHISSTLCPRPDERGVLPRYTLRAQELLIGGSDIKGTTTERRLCLPRPSQVPRCRYVPFI